jgi:hypothetical protein
VCVLANCHSCVLFPNTSRHGTYEMIPNTPLSILLRLADHSSIPLARPLTVQAKHIWIWRFFVTTS